MLGYNTPLNTDSPAEPGKLFSSAAFLLFLSLVK
jgi:hypothetical protein